MHLIPFPDFRKLSGLSDSTLVHLLDRSLLPVSVDKNGVLMIDIDSVESTNVIASIVTEKERILGDEKDILSEKIATIIAKEVDRLFHEALELALKS